MQTPAEKYLIQKIVEYIKVQKNPPRILNIGAGKSLVIEKSVANEVNEFTCDRVDVIDCRIDHPSVDECFNASVESMPNIQSNRYNLAFANYLFEHIEKLDEAAKEIYRLLKPDGLLILSLPNPSAPEFILSKYTPTWFHQLIKGHGSGKEAFETHYAYKNTQDLIDIFVKNNFSMVEIKFYPFTYGYLYKFPLFSWLSKMYDRMIGYMNAAKLMGNICVVFKKQ